MTQNGSKRSTVCTFYSYKGGVGRTLALANVAVLLAQWGYRVLAVDWDLEAPGLHLYYRRFEPQLPPGVVELVEGLSGAGPVRWREHTVSIPVEEAGDRLHLMPAGRLDKDYFRRMQALDWEALYSDRDLGGVLEGVRAEWAEEFDVVLIDSRTGVTDIGGICTVQLPDIVAFLFTANNQSVGGSLEVMRRAQAQREALPLDRAGLLALPIVTRWEANVEVELGREWLSRLQAVLQPWYASWAHKSSGLPDLLHHARLPYVPRWSFGEELPVLDEGIGDPLSLGYALETLAALIANKLENTDLLVANRHAYVDAAKFAKATEIDRYDLDMQILADRADRDFAAELATTIRQRGWRVELETSQEASAESEGLGAGARNLVVVLNDPPSRWLEQAIRDFLRRTLLDEDWRLLIPVIRGGGEAVLPRSLRSLQYVDAMSASAAVVAGTIDALFLKQRADQLEERLGRRHPSTLSARARWMTAVLETPEGLAPDLITRFLIEAEPVLGEEDPSLRILAQAAGRDAIPQGRDPSESGVRSEYMEARKLAINMAVSGRSRDEIDARLVETFNLTDADRSSILAVAFRRVGRRRD